jgi:hypothetical protein
VPYLLDAGATAMCPHGGQVSIVSTNMRVKAGGQAVTVMADTFLVGGCVFMVGPKPQPCMKVQWLVPATRVMIGGQPALLQSSTGLCLSADQIPAGPPNVVVQQLRVQGQ